MIGEMSKIGHQSSSTPAADCQPFYVVYAKVESCFLRQRKVGDAGQYRVIRRFIAVQDSLGDTFQAHKYDGYLMMSEIIARGPGDGTKKQNRRVFVVEKR